MLKPCETFKIKGFLTVLGFQHNSSNNNIEEWTDGPRRLFICVSDAHMPATSIRVLLQDLGETPETFSRIISVIR